MSSEAGESTEAYFVVRRAPDGEAPEEINRAWLDLVLPIEPVPIEAPQSKEGLSFITTQRYHLDKVVTVSLKLALKALRSAGQTEAADWWRARSSRLYHVNEKKMGKLIFDAEDGIVISAAAKERFYPDPL